MATTDPTLLLLRRLVAIDSVNPSLVPGAAGEGEIAGAVEAEMRAVGLEVQVSYVAPGRPNVVGVLQGRSPGRSLMLCGHLDTVGVEGMAMPFEPVERDGFLYGRGAEDMKGGLAAMLGAARLLAEEGGLAAGRLIVAAVADEEHASLGAEALAASWRADGAVVAEPTGLKIALAHKGFAWVEVETEGRAAHGSRPSEGRDAILDMGRVVLRLAGLDREFQSRPPHPLLGVASLHASLISGGTELSTYPAQCFLKMERRTLPGESSMTAVEEVQAILADLGREDPGFRGTASLIFGRPALELAAEHELPQALMRAVRRRGLAVMGAGMSFWTDAAILAAAGIPAVLFGPGGGGLHSTEEHVRLDDVLVCRAVFAELARGFCSS